MRLIDADALKYALGSSDSDIYFSALIDEMPTIASPRDWTPCAEGENLPPDGVYDVTLKNRSGTLGVVTGYLVDGKWANTGLYAAENIIAWKPKPEPYNPDRKEDADHIVDANKKMEKGNKMNKFYEFKKPYYAMIAAPTKERAVELYHDDICDPPDEGEEESEPVEITLEKARKEWDSRGNKEDDPTDIETFLHIENGCSVLIDGALD